MKKLKKEVFSLSFTILTVSFISIIAIFFFQNYYQEKQKIFNALKSADGMMHRMEKNFPNKNSILEEGSKKLEEKRDNRMIFMDYTIYTILLDEEDNILDMINHSPNSMDNKKIESLTTRILKEKKNDFKIGFLLVDKYAYRYQRGNSLILLDNTKITNRLRLNLFYSFFLFLVGELFFFYLARFLMRKITKPVEESFEKQKRFIADASHELKTPTSVIMASCDALEENPKDQKWLKNIKNETERMNRLILHLLDLAATEEIVDEEKAEEDLSKIIELAVLTFESIAFEKNRILDYKIQENIKYSLHSNSIKQLVEILLDNAMKHAKENTKITICLETKKEEIIFTVKNKGEEIPKVEEEKIFERFYRVDKARNREENRYGLGLAIAKNIVTSHHGEIFAKSEDGYTTFQVVWKKNL